ncbi:hypothetical protein GUJ93_ZPchr0005g16111 [Zizania palustris]|uniref:Uncharacterized protein n=1 Tax=Zizania palustris TaxID=103762 RepID=A0A8J5SQ91_ZIZPA|nr:hypothetical protein GUJ93_ZPchr0005g16111 [Zizania palustris]
MFGDTRPRHTGPPATARPRDATQAAGAGCGDSSPRSTPPAAGSPRPLGATGGYRIKHKKGQVKIGDF